MRRNLILILLCAALVAAFSFWLRSLPSREVMLTAFGDETVETTETATSTTPKEEVLEKAIPSSGDIAPQPPLSNPPAMIKAIYATSWSAGSLKKMDALISLIKETELNAIVIDIKDFSGYITYQTDLPEIYEYKAYELRTPKINALLARLHSEGIYAIARVSVFQDGRLSLARPDLALMSSSTGQIWRDRKGLSWIDPASKEAWDYNIAIAKEAFARGFDEVNFDYIRFASDGNLSDIAYPAWNGTTPKANVIRDFWRYVRKELPNAPISADLFGLTAVSYDDLGIGQKIENSFDAFDAIAPMVYPSHYYTGSLGFKNPAEHPYEIVFNSVRRAVERLALHNKNAALLAASSTPPVLNYEPISTIRPWLQDFDLGADYDAAKVRAQIQAVYDAASTTPELISGWMLWNPSNVYTKDALHPEIGN